MSELYEDAYREALALAPSDEVDLATLQITHPLVAEDVFLVADRIDHTLTLEDSSVKVFQKAAFAFSRPKGGEGGIQALNIAIDNVERKVSDYVELVKTSKEPVRIIFRPYLASDSSQPQATPLVLYLSDVSIGDLQVTARAAFADIVNKKFLTELYARYRFPSLANTG